MEQSKQDDFDDEFEDEEPCIRLADGIDIKELLSTSSATFEVKKTSEAALEESCCTYFGAEELLDYVNLDCVDAGSDDECLVQGAPENTPFEKIATKMTNVTDDGKVKKRVIKAGSGPTVETNSVVLIHYNAYVEYSEEPYDSSYLRGRPVKQKMGAGNFIAGLEAGINTMKKGEIAQFLIHPDYGYGKLGCPPRIPQDAELLIQVELLHISEPTVLETVEEKEDSDKPKFRDVLKKAESLHIMGNDLYKKNCVSSAISRYRKAVLLLSSVNLADEEEQLKQQKLLCKLHVNSAICYNKNNNFRMACVECRLALEIQPNNAKALFNFGRALIGLADFNQAKNYLKRAQKEERNNKDINEELQKLEKKMMTYKNDLTKMSKKMFNMRVSNVVVQPEDGGTSNESGFSNEVKNCLDDFVKMTNINTLPLPSGLTNEEETAFKTEAKRRGLEWNVSETRGHRKVTVSKRQ